MTKLKTLLACFAVLLLFSCSDDDKNNNEIKLQKPKITREEFKYFKKLPKLIPKKKGNVSSKNSASEIYEFTIDSTSVTQISYQDKNYFTIAIHRNENLNENSFENLVIVEDLINHNNNAFIIKYFPNDEYFQNLQTTKYPGFKGEITIHKIDYNLISLSYRNDLCITYTQAFCGNNFGPAGPNCYNNQDHGAHIYYKTIEVCSSRSDVPVIVDITDGAGSGFVSGINGGGGSHGTNNSNNLITEPIIMQNRTEQKLLQSFTTIEQNNWWQFVASQETKVQIINYLNQNTTNNVIAPQAVEFVIEVMDYLFNNPAMTWEILMNNRTSFDTNEGEIDDYINGGFDTTTYSVFNPQTQPWPQIPAVIPQNKFIGWNRTLHPSWHCMGYSKEQLRVMGYQISSYYSAGQTFQVYTALNGVNNTALTNGLSYLKYALSNGIPVIVGVDDAPGHTGNLDNTTDHFIVIVGMGSNSTGNYFQFYDNTSGNISQGANSLNLLYYNSSTGLISGTSQTSYAQSQPYPYILTMIRKSKSL